MTDSRGNKVVVCDNGTGVSCARWEVCVGGEAVWGTHGLVQGMAGSLISGCALMGLGTLSSSVCVVSGGVHCSPSL